MGVASFIVIHFSLKVKTVADSKYRTRRALVAIKLGLHINDWILFTERDAAGRQLNGPFLSVHLLLRQFLALNVRTHWVLIESELASQVLDIFGALLFWINRGPKVAHLLRCASCFLTLHGPLFRELTQFFIQNGLCEVIGRGIYAFGGVFVSQARQFFGHQFHCMSRRTCWGLTLGAVRIWVLLPDQILIYAQLRAVIGIAMTIFDVGGRVCAVFLQALVANQLAVLGFWVCHMGLLLDVSFWLFQLHTN